MRRAAAALAVAAAAAACKAAPAEPAGVGEWDVTKTKLRDAGGRCEPTDLPDGRKGSWCYMQPALTVGGQTAQVDLYFDGTQPDAALIELQLKVTTCVQDKVETWARTAFGAPTPQQGGRLVWQNRYLYAALMPAGGSRCLVRIFPLSEKKELDRVLAEPAP